MDETELAWWRDKVSRNIGPDLTRLQAAATRVPAPPQGPLARVQMEDALKRAIGKLRSPNPLSEGEKELIKQGIAELRPMLRAAAGIVDELGMHSSWLSQIYGHAWAALRDRLRDLVPAVVRIERIVERLQRLKFGVRFMMQKRAKQS